MWSKQHSCCSQASYQLHSRVTLSLREEFVRLLLLSVACAIGIFHVEVHSAVRRDKWCGYVYKLRILPQATMNGLRGADPRLLGAPSAEGQI